MVGELDLYFFLLFRNFGDFFYFFSFFKKKNLLVI